MSTTTKIEWCDHTWSPWRGCTKVSPGCANCYAEGLAKRFGDKWGGWGRGKPRVLAKNWGEPVMWNKSGHVCVECGKAQFADRCGTGQCRGSTRRPMVFPSLCDWLDDNVPIEWLARFLGLIYETPNLDWLLLTKRPENWRLRISQASDHPIIRGKRDRWLFDWCAASITPPNVWIGTSIEDQPNADRRIQQLLKIPAKVRFLSVEPMLGPVDLRLDQIEVEASFRHGDDCKGFCDFACGGEEVKGGIDWVIVGGESGPGARPCNVEWIRSVVKQCAAARVPCFVKQLGSNPVGRWTASPEKSGLGEGWPAGLKITHLKGGDPAEWPDDLRVRQFPEVKP